MGTNDNSELLSRRSLIKGLALSATTLTLMAHQASDTPVQSATLNADRASTAERCWQDAQKNSKKEKSPEATERMRWWREARLGLFIHWNPSSLVAGEISWCKDFSNGTSETNRRPDTQGGHEPQGWWEDIGTRVPASVYDNLQKSFYPAMFDAHRYVALAKEAGMKYIIPVCKHHDGFCMWDTHYTDFNIMHTPFKRDIIGELAAAAHAASLKFGVYYSQRDWHHPDYVTNLPRYNAYMRHQIHELLTQYGDIAVLYFDAQNYPAATWETETLLKMVAELHPNIIINDRCGVPADFTSPEQHIGSFDTERNWETTATFTRHWSWHGFDTPVIPFEAFLRMLVHCAGGDGNLLMDIGPLPTGDISPAETDRLVKMGAWLGKYGESIYGTSGGPFLPGEWGASTYRDRVIYLHVLDWSKMPARLSELTGKIDSHVVLTGGFANVTQEADGTAVTMAAHQQDKTNTVIKLTMDSPVV